MRHIAIFHNLTNSLDNAARTNITKREKMVTTLLLKQLPMLEATLPNMSPK
jgi:hypothetical protein